ncbi:MAG: 4Fe-4S dicluster domain-containing protein [Clostridia bacterium]|nr:4Fe-4S dicluster domain-containing protein [Clostridia bacterium]
MNKKMIAEEIVRISGTDPKKCMKCGKCSGSCPAYDEMEFHPHQFVSMVNDGKIERLMASESVFRCLTCFACAERCPRGVEPAKLIEAVRLLKIREKDKNRMNAEDVASFLDEDIPQQAIVSAFRKYAK